MLMAYNDCSSHGYRFLPQVKMFLQFFHYRTEKRKTPSKYYSSDSLVSSGIIVVLAINLTTKRHSILNIFIKHYSLQNRKKMLVICQTKLLNLLIQWGHYVSTWKISCQKLLFLCECKIFRPIYENKQFSLGWMTTWEMMMFYAPKSKTKIIIIYTFKKWYNVKTF